ncbi:MAG: LicD family protein [Eubacteriales bacterium]|nr:LicD family protein [Eubacteriales bacterium]
MEQELLKKIQPVLLEMLKEIQRVCQAHDIPYVLYRGTLLGAVRHRGFIPWDDDLDVAMLRADYEKFCRIAPQALGPAYCFQTWHNDPAYAQPFGKVRKRNTRYIEAKSAPLAENGFYVDVYPLDFAPAAEKERKALARQLLHLYRIKLMKSGYTPWREETRTVWKKRLGYLPYQAAALCIPNGRLVEAYEKRIRRVPAGEILYEQSALPKTYYFETAWFRELGEYAFEDGSFRGPKDFDACLSALYGDYMQLPPEGQRENRHQIMEILF